MSTTAGRNPLNEFGPWRVRLVVLLLFLVGVALAGRLVQLQSSRQYDLAGRAQRQRFYTESIPARPGDVIDRRGRLLATSIITPSLYVVPERIDDADTFAGRLGGAIGIDGDWIRRRVDQHRDKQFLWIKRRLSTEEAEAVRRLELPAETWGFRNEFLRRYPQGSLAAHILGLRDVDGIGRGGLEQKFDHILRGRDGERLLDRDARGRVIGVVDVTEPPQNGQTVVLTLDTVIQLHAERALDALMEEWKPKSACAIVMDPRTCEVLAMVSRPTFDPNDPSHVALTAWKNTSIAAVYEPGSTFKPFVVAWALNKGIIKRNESFHCEHGEYRMGARVLHDHHPFGELSLTDVLVKSSNIGMAKIGEKLTNAELYRAVIAFGFGRKTGSELPGELDGIVRPREKWDGYSTGSIPMGQEIAVTPLQLITAHAALANGGRLMNPRLVTRYVDELSEFDEHNLPGESTAPIVSQTVLPEVAQWVVRGPMTDVVSRGTGKKAQLEGYTVFGKTGTAQKPDPETGEYSSKLHVSSFVAGAPAYDPRAIVLVVADEPSVGHNHYGGSVAAPAAADILLKTLAHLHVPSDKAASRAALK